jgi:hypothetical protein
MLTALALVIGAALGDVALAFAGGLGLRRVKGGASRTIRLGLALVLGRLRCVAHPSWSGSLIQRLKGRP